MSQTWPDNYTIKPCRHQTKNLVCH
uniref:Uncharacterized protein n=1 Tax=Anguilla anguilla TaxID=7936 RepID=A0A0E9U3E6_ANGAN